MPNYQRSSFTIDEATLRQLEELQKSGNRSETIRRAIQELHKKETTPMFNRSQMAAINKADDIIEKFFSNVATSSDQSWLSIRKDAGELFNKRAALLHPEMSPAQAVAHVAGNPDAVSKALYQLQALRSEEQFAHYKQMINGAG